MQKQTTWNFIIVFEDSPRFYKSFPMGYADKVIAIPRSVAGAPRRGRHNDAAMKNPDNYRTGIKKYLGTKKPPAIL